MRVIWEIMVVIAVIAMSCISINANDSIARVGAGGIVLLKTDQIRMVQEHLTISTNTIKVRYRFLNESDTDITTTVAFPMPPYGWAGIPSIEPYKPISPFVAIVDGRPVATKKTKKAVIGSRDVTNDLQRMGLSDKQIFKTFGDPIKLRKEGKWVEQWSFTKTQEKKLKQLSNAEYGFLEIPPWRVAETIYWEQIFPAKKEIEVIHEYRPFVGGNYWPISEEAFETNNFPDLIPHGRAKGEACFDEGPRQAIYKKINRKFKNKGLCSTVRLEHVEYILETGRNWKGPITDFILTIEKKSPDQIVSLCFPGEPKVMSPTTLVFHQTNFVPQDNLVVYFYTVDGK